VRAGHGGPQVDHRHFLVHLADGDLGSQVAERPGVGGPPPHAHRPHAAARRAAARNLAAPGEAEGVAGRKGFGVCGAVGRESGPGVAITWESNRILVATRACYTSSLTIPYPLTRP